MNTKQRILWITRTAIFIALLVVAQGFSKPLGQYVTGSLVNLVLILSVLLGGLASGVTVAALSPVFAFFLGIGPALVPVIPFVMLGNIALVVVWHFIAGKATRVLPQYLVALVVAALAKFLVLYLGVVVLVVGVLLNLPQQQAAVLSATFSFPQLITAGIGGAVASLIVPIVKKALRQTRAAM
ncbi:hypothetical protein LJC61_01160 [Ruminococcaceae bacterium OttesenSCG-928-A16]|nr:hypothetical protein [Ruminococcaceae bacterium OttesenSCG-928-A16]